MYKILFLIVSAKYIRGNFRSFSMIPERALLMSSLVLELMRFLSVMKGRERGTGGGFFHSKGTWGCAAHKGILLRTSSLAKGILFGNFSRL